jgi:hypothetical protein
MIPLVILALLALPSPHTELASDTSRQAFRDAEPR